MLLVFFGPSCSGKSAVAKIIAERTGAEIWSGRDYLRLSKAEPDAERLFAEILRAASQQAELGGGSVIRVVADPAEARAIGVHTIKARFTASPEILRERFRKRAGGQLPAGAAEMIDRQSLWCGNEKTQLKFDTGQMHPGIIADAIMVFAAGLAAALKGQADPPA